MKSLKRAIRIVGESVAVNIAWRLLASRLGAAAAAAATTAAVVSLHTAGGPHVVPITQPWLSSAGSYQVEHVPVPCPGVSVDLSRPAAGVLHTTEGSFESALSVFRRHYAPTFMVGRDRAGRVRILQFCPLGEAAAALENHAGGDETNRWARAQIELVEHSKMQPWLPADRGELDALEQLFQKLDQVAGIPLTHPFPDRLSGIPATYSYAHRSAGMWGHEAGWYGHSDIPENAHWDPGSFEFSVALKAAAALAPKPAPNPKPAPRPIVVYPSSPAFWTWTAWRLGEGAYHRAGPAAELRRPHALPQRIPASWWAAERAFLRARVQHVR